MTVPPHEPPPALPSSTGWPQQPSHPTFVQPAPTVGATDQFELAGWGARLAAYGIDQVIRLVLSIAIAVGGFVLIADEPFSLEAGSSSVWGWSENEVPSFDLGAAESNNLIWMVLTVAALYLVIAIFYAPAFMASWRGATPGKRALGIRVVRADGGDIGLGTAFVREPLVKGLLVNVIASSFAFAGLLSYLWPLWDRECRAGHDFIARTRVVKGR